MTTKQQYEQWFEPDGTEYPTEFGFQDCVDCKKSFYDDINGFGMFRLQRGESDVYRDMCLWHTRNALSKNTAGRWKVVDFYSVDIEDFTVGVEQ